MSRIETTSLKRAFLPIVSVASLLVSLAVWRLLGAVAAIKSGYGVLGVLLAASVFYSGKIGRFRIEWPSYRPQWAEKAAFLVVVLAIAATILAGERAYILLIALPIGYVLLAVQLQTEFQPRRILLQVASLYALSPLTKYLTTGFYFGNSDLFVHTLYTRSLLEAGSVAGIPAYTRYSSFPGLHVGTGTLHLFADIPIDDSLLLLGIVTYIVFISLVYSLAVTVCSNSRLALFVAMAVSLLDPVSFYSTFFYPQSLAFVLVVLLLFVAYRVAGDRANRQAWTLLGVVFSVAIAFTHHLTLVLIAPGILLLLAANESFKYRVDSSSVSKNSQLRALLFSICGVIAISYWSIQDVFISSLVRNVVELLQTGSSDVGQVQLPIYTFGTTLPESTVSAAIISLIRFEGIYFIVLVAAFSLGIVAYLDTPSRYSSTIPLGLVGIVSAIVMFRTPVAIPVLPRARLLLTVFFAFVLGIGLYHFLRAGPPLTMRKALALMLVVSLGVTAPLVAGDDLYGLYAGPDLYELQPAPEPQRAFSEAEYESLKSTSEFVEAYSLRTSTFSDTGRAMEHFTGEKFTGERTRYASIRQSGIRVKQGLFIYRTRWSQYRVANTSEIGGRRSSVVISDKWFSSMTSLNNKVYTTGQVGALYANKTVTLTE